MPDAHSGITLKIHCCHYARDIFPWIQRNLLTPYWRFYWNPKPGGCLSVEGERIELQKDWFYIIPAYLKFSTFAEKPFEQFYIHFSPNDRIPFCRKIQKVRAGRTQIARIRRFIEWDSAKENEQLQTLAAISILSEALLELPEEMFRLPQNMDPRIEELCEFIGGHLERRLSNEEMAGEMKMNRNSFIRLFTAQTGEPPQLYHRRKRIERACELLHFSDSGIDDIAASSGFADRYHFSRVFRKMIRMTPAAYRREYRKFTYS